MKEKKLLSMLTAGALAVTMAMPAMAADQGSVEVNLTTKTGVVRVQVPTTLAVAVDQFELGASGTQIASANFTMVNKSEMDVKVEVASEATVNSGVTLKGKVSEVAAAESTDVFAWLGAAAMTAKDTYYPARGSFASLDENSANVTAFDPATKKATQNFYLAKATGNKTYKVITGVTKTDISYAQISTLQADTTVSGAADDAAKQTALNTLIENGDVYVFTPANGATAIANGDAVTLVEQGASHTYASAEKYYTVNTSAGSVDTQNLTAATVYVYGEMSGTDGGAAGFRYIGKLSNGDKESWTATDISKIDITYTITSISPDNYNANKVLCTYGLYKEPVATYSEISNAYWVSLDGSKGFAAAPTSVKVGAAVITKGTGTGTYSYEKSGWIKLNDKPTAGATIEVVVNGITFTATVPNTP